MKLVHVLVEGQTEEQLVVSFFQPEALSNGIWLNPVMLKTRRPVGRPHDRGGVSRWAMIHADIRRLLRDSSAHTVTTLLDFYGIPSDTPGVSDQVPGDAYARVTHVEQAMGKEVNDSRFLPFLSLHETEAWVLAAADELAALYGRPELAENLNAQVRDAGGPELVNDSPHTAPSKRIQTAYPAYRKVTDGPHAISMLGLDALRNACPHLDAWLSLLEAPV
ncbi:DUF4276 family protein [Streptomyces sp. NPDC050538]|uniref:DUF4276 family protein n=1 Tax=Streptomyces sp. NPDC050538 TaxID=3365627 RepID=UPI0037B1F047